MTQLDPYTIQQLSARKRTATTTYGLAQAALAGQQSQLGLVQNQNLNTLTMQYDQARRRLPGQFQRRGLGNSGIYAQALNQYGAQRVNAFGAQNLSYQGQLNDVVNQQRSNEMTYQDSIANVEEERQARLALAASQLKGLL